MERIRRSVFRRQKQRLPQWRTQINSKCRPHVTLLPNVEPTLRKSGNDGAPGSGLHVKRKSRSRSFDSLRSSQDDRCWWAQKQKQVFRLAAVALDDRCLVGEEAEA